MISTRLLIGLIVSVQLPIPALAADALGSGRSAKIASSATGGQRNFAGLDKAVNALLFDPAESRRAGAAHRLGQIGNPVGVEALIRALRKDPAANVRQAAAQALGRIGSRDGLIPLRYALNNDRDFGVRRAAYQAIDGIEDRARRSRQPVERTEIRDRPFVTEDRSRSTVATDFRSGVGFDVPLVGRGIVSSSGHVVALPTRFSRPHMSSRLDAREQSRQRLLHFYYPDGRPRKYYAGDPRHTPPLYPRLGGKAPLAVLNGTGSRGQSRSRGGSKSSGSSRRTVRRRTSSRRNGSGGRSARSIRRRGNGGSGRRRTTGVRFARPTQPGPRRSSAIGIRRGRR